MSITKATNSGLVGTKYNNVSADNYYMEPIASVLVGSGGQANISFTNIPQGYKHLQIRGISRDTRADVTNSCGYRFNGDSGSNYTAHLLYGDGSGRYAAALASQTYADLFTSVSGSSGSNIFSAMVMDILDYQNATKFKSTRTLSGADTNGGGLINFSSALWMNTAPINSVTIYPLYGSSPVFAQNSRFSLYGIRG